MASVVPVPVYADTVELLELKVKSFDSKRSKAAFIGGVLAVLFTAVILAICLALLLTSSLSFLQLIGVDYGAPAKCDDGWVEFDGNCYFVDNTARDFKSANSLCEDMGANLASISSREQFEFINSLHSEVSMWTGLIADCGALMDDSDGFENIKFNYDDPKASFWTDGTPNNLASWQPTVNEFFSMLDVCECAKVSDKWESVTCKSRNATVCKKSNYVVVV